MNCGIFRIVVGGLAGIGVLNWVFKSLPNICASVLVVRRRGARPVLAA